MFFAGPEGPGRCRLATAGAILLVGLEGPAPGLRYHQESGICQNDHRERGPGCV